MVTARSGNTIMQVHPIAKKRAVRSSLPVGKSSTARPIQIGRFADLPLRPEKPTKTQRLAFVPQSWGRGIGKTEQPTLLPLIPLAPTRYSSGCNTLFITGQKTVG